MATAHNGNAGSHEPGGVADNIRVVTADFPFDSTTQAQNPGLRDEFTFDFLSYNPARDVRTRQKNFWYEFKGFMKLEDTRFISVRTWIWRSASGFQDLQFKVIGGTQSLQWVTMKANLGPAETPTGSASVAASMKYTITNTENFIDVNFNSAVTFLEFNWIVDNTGAAANGNSGGTSQGYTAITYSFGNKQVPGIDYIKIRNSADGSLILAGRVGQEHELSFESVLGSPDTRNRALTQKLKIDGKMQIIDLNPTQLKAFTTDMGEDVDIEAGLRSGQIITFNAGAASVTAEPHFEEAPAKSYLSLMLTGEGVISNVGITDTTYMDWGITVPTEAVIELVGYNA